MAINGVIVHFPMGTGGNLIRNIISLADGFELINDRREPIAQSEKESYLLDYYQRAVTPDTWLNREWDIRLGLYGRYYVNGIISYWNPDAKLAYDNHGYTRLPQLTVPIKCFDRYRIEQGQIQEHLSPYTLEECVHVFITTANPERTAEIYNSKNPNINQFEHLATIDQRRAMFLTVNQNLIDDLALLKMQLGFRDQHILEISSEDLLTSDGTQPILDLVKQLDLDITTNTINQIHANWLQSTREVYYNYFNRELK
jgi:hypothetical protein